MKKILSFYKYDAKQFIKSEHFFTHTDLVEYR